MIAVDGKDAEVQGSGVGALIFDAVVNKKSFPSGPKTVKCWQEGGKDSHNSKTPGKGWQNVNFDDSKWPAAKSYAVRRRRCCCCRRRRCCRR